MCMSKRIAIVDNYKCDPSRCAQECIKYDPINRSGGEGFYLSEETGKATISQEATSEAHQICAKKCPFDAIKLVKLPQEASGKPIHQYDENGFRLYNLAIPQFGKVVGILGRNGIGKSTAVKILSGLVKPNFGDLSIKENDAEYDAIGKLIEHYKGTIAQAYFEKMRDGEIVVAYKPQSINTIPQMFAGTVGELLGKVSEDKERIDELSQKLSLTNFLDHDIKSVSGGELQRIAIAATMLKKANVYIFDEPSSFLDIKQRLIIARILRELADEDTSVIVIEHDLILLDYMTDFVHIIYGEQAAYGIISKVKTSKNGINIYLNGYIPDENIQFRPNKIEFYGRVERADSDQPTLAQWSEINKSLGTFQLRAKAGKVKKHDVVGILGENGIGKSTFAKLLAGEMKADSGEIDTQVSLSYKPQHIDTNSDELVMSYLGEISSRHDAFLIKPLGIEKLMMQELKSLSGGQIQIVEVAKCLMADVQLFLLDEPSAYLDTEQRLVVSKVIRDLMMETGKTALIIDHDLLFIDYLSDKLLVFEGEPAKAGNVTGPFGLQDGMNEFLQDINLTFRRDEETNRPRANKVDSQIDQKQKNDKTLYII